MDRRRRRTIRTRGSAALADRSAARLVPSRRGSRASDRRRGSTRRSFRVRRPPGRSGPRRRPGPRRRSGSRPGSPSRPRALSPSGRAARSGPALHARRGVRTRSWCTAPRSPRSRGSGRAPPGARGSRIRRVAGSRHPPDGAKSLNSSRISPSASMRASLLDRSSSVPSSLSGPTETMSYATPSISEGFR